MSPHLFIHDLSKASHSGQHLPLLGGAALVRSIFLERLAAAHGHRQSPLHVLHGLLAGFLTEVVIFGERVNVITSLVHDLEIIVDVRSCQLSSLLVDNLLDFILNRLMKFIDLCHLLMENLSIVLQMIGKSALVMLSADPALSRVHPVVTFFDLVMTQHAGENDLIHVAGHRVLYEKIVGDLIDSHEHEGQLARRAILVLLHDLHFSSLLVTLDSQLAHLLEHVFLLLFCTSAFLLIGKTELFF